MRSNSLKTVPTMALDTTFGQAHGAQQALAQLKIADAAFRFIRQGLKDLTGRAGPVRIESLEAQVRLRMQDRGLNGVIDVSSEVSRERKAAIRAFHAAFKGASSYLFPRIPAPWLYAFEEDDERASAKEVLDLPLHDRPTHKDPLHAAYLMSSYNVTRAEQRITLLYLLADVLRGNGSSLPPAAQAEFDVASPYFWAARQYHLVRLLAMGTLLGGSALEANKALVKEMYGEGISIMELLEPDCIHPGQYLTKDERKFKAALKKA